MKVDLGGGRGQVVFEEEAWSEKDRAILLNSDNRSSLPVGVTAHAEDYSNV